MSIESEVKIRKLEEQVKEMQFQMSQILSAISAMIEVNNTNAVVEGGEIEPKARNGKVKKV